MSIVKVGTEKEIEALKSEKLKMIINNPLMYKELRALIFMKSLSYKEIFSLSDEEIKEFKTVYNPDKLIDMGHRYIIDYITSQGEFDLLDMYLGGEAKLKAEHSLQFEISTEDVNKINDCLAKNILASAFKEPDLKVKIKASEFIQDKYATSKVVDDLLIDQIQELLVNEDF